MEYFDLVFDHHYEDSECSPDTRYARVFDLFTAHEDEIARPLMEFLNSKPQVRIIGPPEVSFKTRVPTISLVVNGRRPEEISKILGQQNIGIGAGDFYARRCIDALDLGRSGGVVRISMVHYNSATEVERLINALDEVL